MGSMTNEALRAKWPSGLATLTAIRERTDTILLSFSAGKDSLAAWLVLREHFPRIVPVYKYLVPGLGFVERSLAYYEQFFGTRIHRYPHPSFYRWLRRLTFQAPQNTHTVLAANLPEFAHDELMARVRQDRGLPQDCPVAIGTRACDSPQRRLMFAKRGPVSKDGLTFCPVWDMDKADVVRVIADAGARLPVDYRIFGRSFDGIDFRFLYGIKRHWPEDYERILEFFPLAELELKRYEYAQGATP